MTAIETPEEPGSGLISDVKIIENEHPYRIRVWRRFEDGHEWVQKELTSFKVKLDPVVETSPAGQEVSITGSTLDYDDAPSTRTPDTILCEAEMRDSKTKFKFEVDVLNRGFEVKFTPTSAGTYKLIIGEVTAMIEVV